VFLGVVPAVVLIGVSAGCGGRSERRDDARPRILGLWDESMLSDEMDALELEEGRECVGIVLGMGEER
jgi:hypothetical protein